MKPSRDRGEGEIGRPARTARRHLMRAVPSGLLLLLIPVATAVAAAGSEYHKYRRMFKGYCRGAKAPEALRVLKRRSRPPLLSATGGIGFRCVKPHEALPMGAAAQKLGMFAITDGTLGSAAGRHQ